MLRTILFTFGTIALGAFWIPAQAQTPDGTTPAEEKADGVTKGLYRNDRASGV